MQKVVLTEDNAKSVMIDILQYYKGSKLSKNKSEKGTNEVAATLATPKSQDEVKWTSINARSNVISMCTVPVKIKGSSGNR